MRNPKILIWDIETADLRADWAPMLCAAYRWHGKSKVHCIKAENYPRKSILDDSGAVAALVKVLNQADIWVTHYGTKFDGPFIEARAAKWGLDPCGARFSSTGGCSKHTS